MIEFKGTSEEQWLKTPGHRVKDLIKKLTEYKKKNPNNSSCPFLSKAKK